MKAIYKLTYRNKQLTGFYKNGLASGVKLSEVLTFSHSAGYSGDSIAEIEALKDEFIKDINAEIEYFESVTFPEYKRKRQAFVLVHNSTNTRKEKDDSEDVYNEYMATANKILNILNSLKITAYNIEDIGNGCYRYV